MSIDDDIRRALRGAFPEPTVTDPAALAAELAARVTGTPGGGTPPKRGPWPGRGGPGPLAFFGAAGLVLGAGTGFAIGAFTGGQEATLSVQVGADTAVPAYACPGAGIVDELVRGDRVYAIGKTDDGAWIVVRDVRDGYIPVFVDASYIELDAAADLETMSCDDVGTWTPYVEATTPSPASSPTPTETSAPAPHATAKPTPDTTPPSLANAAGVPGNIWEQDGGGITCPGSYARTSTVSVNATDNKGVASASMTYTVPGAGSVTRTMSKSGSTWSATFGPVAHSTVPEPGPHSVSITITVKDTSGNSATTSASVSVHSIAECFG